MTKRKKEKKIKKNINNHNVLEEQKLTKNNTLIFSGLILALISIGLLIFVLSEKVFHLSYILKDSSL